MMSRAAAKGKTWRVSARGTTETQQNGLLLLLAAGFLSGALLGGFFAGRISFEPYITEFLQDMMQISGGPALWRELWSCLRWPVAVWLLGSLPWAGLTMPTLFFLRGALLSCGIGAVAAGRGPEGILWAGILFGPTCVLTVPVMFVLGTDRLLRRAAPSAARRYAPLRLGLCAAALAACVLVDQKAVPPVLSALLQAFWTE